ncbi:MAG TPA: hypothetical protein VKW77_00785, partial [Acidimicrobiales bacterium]|nr:hypothetical protein [Acidimicrobiales bacterium]
AVSSDGVHVVGTATLHGTPTTAYAADVDLGAYVARVDPDAAPSIQALERQIGASKLPVVVWVDGQGRLRQLEISFGVPSASAAASGSASVHLTLQVWDYGVPVHVVAPPADETQDVTGQVTGAGAGGPATATAA